MPEFILNADRCGKHPYYQLSNFAKGYVEAMFFTNGDTGDEREFLLNDMGVERLTRKAVADIAKDCETFWNANKADLEAASEAYGEDRAGNDFWYTRQGHGVGYRDRYRDIGEELADRLHKAAQKFGEAYPEVSRGWIYHR